jgi:hypothetical protein
MSALTVASHKRPSAPLPPASGIGLMGGSTPPMILNCSPAKCYGRMYRTESAIVLIAQGWPGHWRGPGERCRSMAVSAPTSAVVRPIGGHRGN